MRVATPLVAVLALACSEPREQRPVHVSVQNAHASISIHAAACTRNLTEIGTLDQVVGRIVVEAEHRLFASEGVTLNVRRLLAQLSTREIGEPPPTNAGDLVLTNIEHDAKGWTLSLDFRGIAGSDGTVKLEALSDEDLARAGSQLRVLSSLCESGLIVRRLPF